METLIKSAETEGKANRYSGVGGGVPGVGGGSLQTATVLDGGWAYRTRVMVRTPAREKFNGTLIVEWTNVTVGADFEFANAEASKYLLREGYAAGRYPPLPYLYSVQGSPDDLLDLRGR